MNDNPMNEYDAVEKCQYFKLFKTMKGQALSVEVTCKKVKY